MARKVDPDRLAAVEQALTAMESHQLIVRRLSREWGCKPRTIWRYVHDVLRRWQTEDAARSVDDWRTRIVMMTIDLYRRAIKANQLRAANETLQSLSRLLGVSEVKARGVVNIYARTGAYTSEAGKAITAEVKRLLEGDTEDVDPN